MGAYKDMNIEYSKKAVKIINRLDIITKQRIRQSINDLPDGDIKRLAGQINTWRLRVGDWRILFSYPEYPNKDIILVEKVAPRGQIYKEGL